MLKPTFHQKLHDSILSSASQSMECYLERTFQIKTSQFLPCLIPKPDRPKLTKMFEIFIDLAFITAIFLSHLLDVLHQGFNQ